MHRTAAGKQIAARIESIIKSGANATAELEQLQSECREALAAGEELRSIMTRGQDCSDASTSWRHQIRDCALAILEEEGQALAKKLNAARQRYRALWSQLFGLVKCFDYDIRNFERMPHAGEAAERFRRAYTESPQIETDLVLAAVPEWLQYFRRLVEDEHATRG
jgi:hypothetical protein